jgi:hypothetical protein
MNHSSPNQTGLKQTWGDAKQVAAIFGLARTPLYRLAKEGRVRSASLLSGNASRGKRLFDLTSIESLLNGLAGGAA